MRRQSGHCFHLEKHCPVPGEAVIPAGLAECAVDVAGLF